MKNNQSHRKKSSMPFRVNRKSILGIISLVVQELIDKLLTETKIKKPKEIEVLDNVRKYAIQGQPESVLKIIDNYAYKKTFLMNIGKAKGLLLENEIKNTKAERVLELGVYLGYSSIRILKNLTDRAHLVSIESNNKFAEIAQEHIGISGLSERHSLKIGKSSDVIPTFNEQFDFIFIDHWKDLYLKDLQILESCNLLKKGASIFADNVILFDLEDYLNYVRSSPNYSSKFIPALREYSKSHPDGVEISKFK